MVAEVAVPEQLLHKELSVKRTVRAGEKYRRKTKIRLRMKPGAFMQAWMSRQVVTPKRLPFSTMTWALQG